MELRLPVSMHFNGEVSTAMNFFHRARQRSYDWRNFRDRADDRQTGGKPCALEVTSHLVAHNVGLLENFFREWLVAVRCRFIDHNRQWGLQRMREITNMGT